MADIKGFKGPYRFLSNFWPARVQLDGFFYPSVEHAYQAAKTLDEHQRETIRLVPKPGDAKKLGKWVTVRYDWEEIKLGTMDELLRQKFFNNEDLRTLLLSTGDAYLEETNLWLDCYWGVCKGQGENHLGRLLMEIRKDLQEFENERRAQGA